MPTLDFEGKEIIHSYHFSVPYRPLVPDPDRSLNPVADGEDNLIIHGDNLHALKALLPRYSGRVKCIYIDPPYNNGNTGWVYNDNVNHPQLRAWLGTAVGRDDLQRHDKWACMMWPRLHLLKELLADNGAIFISINYNEQHHLRMMMDEIFGEENFVADFPWQSRLSVSNDIDLSVQHEQVLAYALNRRRSNRRLRKSNSERWYSDPSFAVFPKPLEFDGYSNPDNDPRGDWKLDPFDAPHESESLTYAIVNPDTGEEHWPPAGRQWRMLEENYRRLADDGRIMFGRGGESRPMLKAFYQERRPYGQTRTSWWPGDEYGTTTDGTRTLMEIFGGATPFDYPKPVSLVSHILQMGSGPNDIILDSFAGSGTTAQAVLALNKQDGGNRKFILVECEDYSDTITAERVRRVINGVPDSRDQSLREGLGGSFTYCTLGNPLEVEGMLKGDLPEFGILAAYLLYTAAGITSGAANLQPQNEDGLFYSDDRTDYHLIYQPSVDWLCSDDAALTAERAQRIRDASRERGRSALVYAACKYISQRALTRMGGIRYCQLPYEMHHPAA